MRTEDAVAQIGVGCIGCGAVLLQLAIWGGLAYAIFHFTHKYW